MAKKIVCTIDTGYVGAKYKQVIDAPEEWDEMTEDEQERYLDETAQDYLWNHISYNAYILED